MLTLSKVMCNLNNKAITALLKLYDAQKGVRDTTSATAVMGLQMKLSVICLLKLISALGI